MPPTPSLRSTAVSAAAAPLNEAGRPVAIATCLARFSAITLLLSAEHPVDDLGQRRRLSPRRSWRGPVRRGRLGHRAAHPDPVTGQERGEGLRGARPPG